MTKQKNYIEIQANRNFQMDGRGSSIVDQVLLIDDQQDTKNSIPSMRRHMPPSRLRQVRLRQRLVVMKAPTNRPVTVPYQFCETELVTSVQFTWTELVHQFTQKKNWCLLDIETIKESNFHQFFFHELVVQNQFLEKELVDQFVWTAGSVPRTENCHRPTYEVKYENENAR